jgi:hypothetical protein
MKNTRVLLPALLLFFLFSFAGCYTILKHPAGSDEGHQYSQEYYRENCLDCHPDYHEYPYGYYHGYYPEYYFDNPRWGRYYVYPWWWDHYWYDSGDDYYEDDLAPGDAHDKASHGQRGRMIPPYSIPGTSTFQRDAGAGGRQSQKSDDNSTQQAGKQQDSSAQNQRGTAPSIRSGSKGSATQSEGTKETKKEEKKSGKKGSATKKGRR